MITKVAILGAGGFAREVLDVFDAVNAATPTYDVLGFIVDADYGQVGRVIHDKPVLGDLDWFSRNRDVAAICGVGAPEIRYRMIARANAVDVEYCSVVHPNAVRTRWLTMGVGVVITAACVLTNQITIGNHVQVNLDCTIGHDAVLEDFVTLAPGVHVSGNVTLGEGCYVGTGANIIEKRRLGAWSVIGAGATVVRDIPDNVTAVGTPAAVVKQRESGWHLS